MVKDKNAKNLNIKVILSIFNFQLFITMQINQSGAQYSSIVGIGEKLKKISAQTGEDILMLNRGINAVCLIDLSEVVKQLPFNSVEMQAYAPNKGIVSFREAINHYYFHSHSDIDNLFVTTGGSGAIDLVFDTLLVENFYIARYYWGPYVNIMTIRGKKYQVYPSFQWLKENIKLLRNSAVVICDPNNPVGDKYDDTKLMQLIKLLNDNGIVTIIDSPYRRVFYDHKDTFYSELVKCESVIIIESFSKSIGLSGQRIGFIHCTNKDLQTELNIRLLYATNGTNTFSQLLVRNLLTTTEGKAAVTAFRHTTLDGIRQNIDYLITNNLLAEKFYQNSEPVGIFAIVNKTEAELLRFNIGSVGLQFFTDNDAEATQFSRICVSVPHLQFKSFFNKLIEAQS